MSKVMLLKFIRLRDAPHYLGMSHRLFNEIVRPYVVTIPIGQQGVGFDRDDLDAWANDYKANYGKPAQLNRATLPINQSKRIQQPNLKPKKKQRFKQSEDEFEKILEAIRLKHNKKTNRNDANE